MAVSPRSSFSFGDFINGLIRTRQFPELVGNGGAVADDGIQAQRGALFQRLKATGAGQSIINALIACGRDSKRCELTPELVTAMEAARGQFGTPVTFAYSPQQLAARARSQELNVQRFGPSMKRYNGNADDCRTNGGTFATRKNGSTYCRRRGSSTGPGARSPVARQFRREVDLGLRPNTWDSCVAIKGSPITPSGWTAGADRLNPILGCRDPTIRPRGGSFSAGGNGDPRVAAALAAAAGARPAVAAYDYEGEGEDYGYDDEVDYGYDDGSNGMSGQYVDEEYGYDSDSDSRSGAGSTSGYGAGSSSGYGAGSPRMQMGSPRGGMMRHAF